jgi:hypothetical protein
LSSASRDTTDVLKEGKPFSYFLYDITSGAGGKDAGIMPEWRLFWVRQMKSFQGIDQGISTMVTRTRVSAVLYLAASSCCDA